MNRVVLFIATNLAVVAVLSLILSLLGVNKPGTDMTPFLVMTALIGMGGSFISLMLSKTMAKRAMGCRIIEQPSTPAERWLVDTVARQARQAGIGMPEVAVFDSPTPNAFATGADRNHALVAVSSGLLRQMGEDEVEAVLGHEVSHVANGDMVTLTLIQGVVNTFVMVFASVLAGAFDRGDQRNGSRGMGYYMGYMIAQTVLGFLASMIVCWFSRQREFRADAGGASLAGRHKMIAALERLQAAHNPAPLPGGMAAFGISGGALKGFAHLFATHPPLELRIEALRRGA
ncbi:MAG TPA: protease HtpX [Gammaproteobacteria bacterium]|nr:protease HtpX [Gammaproteobacteria bacterium]